MSAAGPPARADLAPASASRADPARAAATGRPRCRLIALDVDGTLVDRSLKVRPRNREALAAARAAGVSLVLATGRMFRSALPYAELLDADQPLVCYQGAMVRTRDGQTLREWAVAPEAAARAVELSRAHRLHVNLYQDDNFYVEDLGEGARRYAAVAQVEAVKVDDLMAVAAGGSTKVVFVDDPQRLRALEPELRAAFEPASRITFSLPEFLEVVSAGADKGGALAFVCQRAGINPAEVVAAGDAPNDVEMLRFAGLALAPRDAFPEARAAADALIPPPQEDGIAELVERWVLG
ncbi:MAG TPA: Cof-type HAD-IIB family hydrolase [Candidatus Dormibacteraeota bacterium]|nr:Cof-type HAD-IIB family hydrolase [Candidatus Dormibacteraeota bacterium]